MLQAGILNPVHQTTSWINSFVLVEGKDKLGKLKLRNCLDPTILKHQKMLPICLLMHVS